MPEDKKLNTEDREMVDIDTSGPEVEVDISDKKDDKRTYEKEKDHGTDISFENERETKVEENEPQVEVKVEEKQEE